MKYTEIYISLLLLVTCMAQGSATSATPDSIPDLILQQQISFPQEKIYVQTDKPHYVSGDTIWFRAYLVDACTHTPSALSNFVYADLLDPHDQLVDRIKVIKDNGIFKGYIDLPEELHAGDYRLCVYTRYMHLEQNDYLFQKKLPIDNYFSTRYLIESSFKSGNKEGELIVDLLFKEFNKEEAIIPKVEYYNEKDEKQLVAVNPQGHFVFKLNEAPRNNILHIQYTIGGYKQGQYLYIPALRKDYDVSFFPEGGHLPGNSRTRIAFKALNTDGLGEDIKGFVLNSRGDTVVQEFKSAHLGMGAFDIFCDPSLSYRVICQNKNGRKKEFTLPPVSPDMYALSASWRKGSLYLSVNKNSNNVSNKPLYLTILCRGKVLYSKKWENYYMEQGNFLRFQEETFPTGILQLLLTDENNIPLSERLVFNINKEEEATVKLKTNKDAYDYRELVKASVQVLDGQNKPLASTLSVSVTDKNVVKADTTMNILSTLLLTSELKGYIESPAFYFSGNYADKQEALDALMLTQGWSRYNISQILKGETVTPANSPETSQQIKGKLYRGTYQNKPAANYPVRLFATETGKFMESETREDGSFCFDNILFADSTIFVVQGNTPKEKNYVLLEIEKDSLGITNAPFTFAVRPPDKEWIERETKQKTHILSQGDIARTYQLDGVEVTAPKIEKRPYFYVQSPYSSEFNKSIGGKELIERHHPSNTMEMLQFVTGVSIYKDGPTTYPYFNVWNSIPPPPAYIIMDNMPVEPSALYTIMPQYIAKIEVVRGARIATIGPKGMNGTILITTSMLPVDQEVVPPTNIQTIAPLGYQVTKDFYSPQYKTKEQQSHSQKDNRSTLYWDSDLKTTENKSGQFQFYTSDQVSPFVITLEGLSEDGKVIHWEGEISRHL